MAASAERVFEFLNEDEEKERVREFKEIKEVKGNIKFENIKFGYNPDRIIIKGFSADISAGQKVAIVDLLVQGNYNGKSSYAIL